MWRIASLLAWIALGCAHQPASPTELDRAYDEVAKGSSSARGGGYLVERTGESMRVVRETPIGGLGSDVSDAWITTKVKGKLGLDQGVSARNVHVTTDAGMVTLQGKVASRDEAMNAIRDTLDLDGVTAVSSQLEWPQARATISPETTRF